MLYFKQNNCQQKTLSRQQIEGKAQDVGERPVWIVNIIVFCYCRRMALAFNFMLCAWLFACCSEINASPDPETVTRARCYANCVTSVNTGNTDQDKICQKKTCQECLGPCKERFTTEQECFQKCSNSSSCIASCTFVSRVKNFNGDGSMPSNPGIALVNSTDFSSISLQWSPVTNSTGTPVYLIGMTYSGDQTRSNTIYFDEVYLASRATLMFTHLCRFIRSAPIRSSFNGIFYKFRLAVLTENSSVSYGPETDPISLRKPDPVSNVTLESVQYDGSNSGDKLKISVSWTPSERQKHLITKFAVVWDEQCHEALPRPWETKGPQPILSVHVYQKLKKCSHTLEVYAMINCSVSDPATLIYQYSGCINVTDYPKDICYDFDPPEAPLEDRIVTNITYGEMIANDDYTFSMMLNWNPPIYPYKKVERYSVRWGEVSPGGNWFPQGGRAPQDPHFLLQYLLPGRTYLVKILPLFVRNQPTSASNDFSFTTPAVPPDEVRVRSLKSGKFVLLPQTEIFTLNISWLKPSFNYSKLSSYTVFYQIGPDNTVLGTNQTHFVISGISHGWPVTFMVTPKYEHDWINGSTAVGSDKAPVPPDDEVKVQNLLCGDFLPDGESGTFIVNVSWTDPRFNFSFKTYALDYDLSGYSHRTKVKQNTNRTRILISTVRPKEILTFKVLPQYENQFIQGLESTCVKSAPEPNATLLMVQDLRYQTSENNNQLSFNYNVSWEKPLFEHSSVASYTVLNRRKGNPEREKEFTLTLVKNSFIAQDLIPGDILDVKVVPVFAASVITGLKSATTIKPPGPSDEQNEVRNLNVALFVEDEEENTYYVNFTWQSPSFQFSSVKHYNVFYEFSGYTQDRLQCVSLARAREGCFQTGLKTTSIEISGILPRETVSLEVTPVYNNIHIIGRMANKRGTAPEPREQLVTVVGLQHSRLVSSYNNTFRTSVTWKKPLFTYSDIKHYRYRTYVVSDVISETKRRQVVESGLTTPDTNVTVDGIIADSDIAFEVTPVFVESVVSGRPAVITLSRKILEGIPSAAKSLSPAEVGGLVGGVLSFLLILIGGVIWFCRERQKQMGAKGLVSGKNAFMIDQWEVDGDLVSLEEELGEGAFGKVYKGFLSELPKPSRKLSLMPPISSTRRSTIKSPEGFTVAVKMLHGMADSEQRREFLEEIQLMKAVGSHKNIVNMIGCCTVEEPMFLLVEYIPYGDLLHYLRKRRGKVKEYLGDESRGPYRSTYCETYMIDGAPGGVSLQVKQMPRDDHVYANTPFAPKGDDGNIQLLSFNNTKKGAEIGTDNTGLTKDEADEKEDENEETLSPGDLMAFAWQISQGMEYLARKGFVHRDLAARNILVGDNKIAKVADFGLTRHVYEEKVYHAKRNRKLPLKWMSIEAIFDQTFTTQSDVWAFGVVLWELVTLGGTPYPTINNRELLRLLRDGYRMEKPEICNDDIYDLMIDCWKDIPEDRPTFTQIREKLEEMMQRDNPYLDFSVLDETREYYNVPSFNSLQDETTDDELFERDNEDLEKVTTNTVEHKTPEDANANETSIYTEGIMFLEKEGKTENLDLGIGGFNNSTYQGTRSNNDLKNVKINVDELEMSLYRPRHRGLVL